MRRWLILSLLVGCTESSQTPDAGPQPTMTRPELLDPQTCAECHPKHVEQWEGSMHAYAAEDPLFIAMNRLGQQETDGALGDFCVACHAPIAVREGLTTDGLNLAELPAYSKGITCAFCHMIDEIQGSHNAAVGWADDMVLRGPIADPKPNTAHASVYSKYQDGSDIESSKLCGACHDIVTPAGVHIERTYLEWQASLYAHDVDGERQTCGDCHMKGRTDVAADSPGVPLRRVHDHSFIGVDVALTDFPHMEEQKAGVQRALNTTVLGALCVRMGEEGGVELHGRLENMAAGHGFPSGATIDRRAWVELIAYDDEGAVLFSSGEVLEGQPLTDLNDNQLWRLGDTAYDADGHPTHDFWEVVDYDGLLLPSPNHQHENGEPVGIDNHLTHDWNYAAEALPARVTFRLRLRPVGLDVIDHLVAEADLDPAIRAKMPTFNMGAATVEWQRDQGIECVPRGHEEEEP